MPLAVQFYVLLLSFSYVLLMLELKGLARQVGRMQYVSMR